MQPYQTRSAASWLWCGFPGHFIAAESCRFRLCTTVGEGRWRVSTVGDYRPARSEKAETIGINRLYETMVFATTKQTAECGCPEMGAAHELDFDAYNDALSARLGHVALCEKWDTLTEVPDDDE